MRLSIVRDGKRETVDVDPTAGTVQVAGRDLPYQVVAESPARLELEVAGEKVVVEGWPHGLSAPPGPVDVNGERWRVSEVRVESGAVATTPGPGSPIFSPPPAVTAAPAVGAPPMGEGVPVLPPMPGKVIEVRVRVGDHIAKDQVLLVLEAMKMRNEVASPVKGTVLAVAVSAGSNVRAREAMVLLAPD